MKGVFLVVIILFCFLGLVGEVHARGEVKLKRVVTPTYVVVINEFVTNPQTDWGGNNYTTDGTDEWFELFNNGSSDVDLTNWTLSLVDSTSVNEILLGTITAGGYFTILNPTGAQNNDGQIILYDDSSNIIDQVRYGSWVTESEEVTLGATANAPSGKAEGVFDECLARSPNGQDTDTDSLDWVQQTCTYNSSNDGNNTTNSAPILDFIGNQTVEENSTLSFTVSSSDADGDSLSLSINETLSGAAFRDSGTGNTTFSWTPNTSQAGSYEVTFSVSDGSLTDEQEVIITVTDLAEDGDADGDGLADSVDKLTGCVEDVSTNFDDLNLTVNDSSQCNQSYTENLSVVFKNNNTTLIEFYFDFSSFALNLSNLTIKKQDNTSLTGSLLISGLGALPNGETKTVYLDNLTQSTGICILDEEITLISQVSSTCTGSTEVWVACDGTNGPYSCTYNSTLNQYQVTGLNHSGIKALATYCGDSSCNGAESCSSCFTDCGSCSSSSGGGGGGGSSTFGETNVTDEGVVVQPVVSTFATSCQEKWECHLWNGECINGYHVRRCNDVNNCGTTKDKPEEKRICFEKKKTQLENQNLISPKLSTNTKSQVAKPAPNLLTGAVVSNLKNLPTYSIVFGVVIILGIILAALFLTMKKKN